MIDFHSHFFSHSFFETLAHISPLPGSVDEKLAGVVAKTGLELPSPVVADHWSRWKGMLDANSIDHCVSFASLPDEVPSLVEAMQLAEGRMSSFALVNPLVEGTPEKVRLLLGEKGFKGILLFPAMHHFDPSGEEASAVYEVVDSLERVVVVHCGMLQVKLRDLLGLPRDYDFTFADPLRLVPAANCYRNARFVIPHFGAGMFRETLMAGNQCENIYVDTSSSNSWIATQPSPMSLGDVFARTVGVFGGDRVLFGTDSSTLPRGFRADLLKAQRDAMAQANLSPADQDRILDGNARRLLRIA